MKKFILLMLFCAAAFVVKAQRSFFIYIQTETPAPFYVKMGDKIWSSTSQGYLIIPSLHDSAYQLTIGSPGQKERKFSVTVGHKDRGFLLKDFSGSWGLFDLQSMEVISALPEERQPEPIAYRSDEFSRKLALAVDDPSLLFVFAKAVPVVPDVLITIQKEDKPPVEANDTAETKKEESAADNATVKEGDVVKEVKEVKEPEMTDTSALVKERKEIQAKSETEVVASDPVKEEKPYQRSVVTRRSESSTTEGFGLVFLDKQDGATDTIRILIPNPKVIYKTEADLRSEAEVASGTREPQKTEHELTTGNDTANVLLPPPTCPDLATESDYKKLRKEMVSKDNEEDMLDRARKMFRAKCFTTEQIKTLGALFLTPGGRYSFFDAAYGHVSDPSRFGTLKSELSNDEYYLKRFKALIGE